MEVRHAPTDVVSLLRTCIATIQPLAQQKQLTLTLEPAPERIVVDTDAAKARQIVLNLLSNAVKFTDSGEVRLGVARRGDDVTLTVADTGMGMPADALGVIFEEFRQLDSGENRRYGGSGLGLTLSRKLARALGGELEVESAEGKGSRFTLRLPGASSEPIAQPRVDGSAAA
jgi:signal transduction histidine kinase